MWRRWFLLPFRRVEPLRKVHGVVLAGAEEVVFGGVQLRGEFVLAHDGLALVGDEVYEVLYVMFGAGEVGGRVEGAKALQQGDARLGHEYEAGPRLDRAVRTLRVEFGDEAEGVEGVVCAAVPRNQGEGERGVGLGGEPLGVIAPVVDEEAEVLVVVVDALDMGAQAAFGIGNETRILLVGVWVEFLPFEGVYLFLGQHVNIIPKLPAAGLLQSNH